MMQFNALTFQILFNYLEMDSSQKNKGQRDMQNIYFYTFFIQNIHFIRVMACERSYLVADKALLVLSLSYFQKIPLEASK